MDFAPDYSSYEKMGNLSVIYCDFSYFFNFDLIGMLMNKRDDII